MPKTEEYHAVFEKSVEPAIKSIGFEAILETAFQQFNITNLFDSIREAKLVIADVTSTNTNVFYELGISAGLRKPTILLSQSGTSIPDVLVSYRLFKYSLDSSGLQQLKYWLTKSLRSILKESPKISSFNKSSKAYREKEFCEKTAFSLPIYRDNNKIAETEEIDLKNILKTYRTCQGSSQTSAYRRLGALYQDKGEFEKALLCYQQALMSKEPNSLDGLFNDYISIGNVLEKLGQPAQAIEFYERALNNINLVKDERLIGKILSARGDALQQLGRYDEAMHSYVQAIDFFQKTNAEDLQSKAENNIAVLLLKRDRFSDALPLFEKLLRTIKDDLTASHIWHNLAYIDFREGKLEEAKECLEKSINIKRKNNDREGLAASLVLLAQIELSKKNQLKTIQLLEKAARIQEEIGDKNGLIQTYQTLASTLDSVGDVDHANRFRMAAISLAVQIDSPERYKLLKNLNSRKSQAIKGV